MIPREFNLTDVKTVLQKYYADKKEGWHANYWQNHDQAQSVSRFANDAPEYRERSAKLLALLQCALGGTIYIYQGQDIGMINVPKDWGFEEYKDVASIQWVEGETEKRRRKTGQENPDMSDLLPYLRAKSRDNARTPMQWDTSADAGFTKSGKPWMRVHDDYKEWNVEVQRKNPDSINNFYTKLFETRKENLALVYGDFKILDFDNEQIFAFTRNFEDKSILVVLNFTDKTQTFELPKEVKVDNAKVLIGTQGKDGKIVDGGVKLEAYEGVAFTL